MKFSIITCCKNSLPYLKDNIKSVQNQNYRNFEHLFICSKSTDGTDNFLKKINYKKKRVFFLKSTGVYKAINYGIKKSKGDVIFLLHSDDLIINKTLLQNTFKKFKTNSIDFLYGNIKISKKNNKKKILRLWNGTYKVNNKYLFNMPAHTSFFIKKKIFKKLGLYNTRFNISSDLDFLLKLFSNKKYNYLFVNKYFIIMRNGGISSSVNNIISKIYEDIIILFKYYNFYSAIIYILKIISKIKQLKIFK